MDQGRKDAISRVCAERGLGDVRRYRRANGSLKNSVFIVTTSSGEYVVRYHTGLGPGRVTSLAEFLVYLKQRGLPVPEPCPTCAGELVSVVNGSSVVVLTYVGSPIEGTPDLDSLSEAIDLIPRIQRVKVPARFRHLLGCSEADFVLSFNRFRHLLLPCTPPSVDKVLDRISPLVHRLWNRGFIRRYRRRPRVLNHGDFHLANLLFTDGSLGGVIDWDWPRLDTPECDLSMLCASALMSTPVTDCPDRFRELIAYSRSVLDVRVEFILPLLVSLAVGTVINLVIHAKEGRLEHADLLERASHIGQSIELIPRLAEIAHSFESCGGDLHA